MVAQVGAPRTLGVDMVIMVLLQVGQVVHLGGRHMEDQGGAVVLDLVLGDPGWDLGWVGLGMGIGIRSFHL